MSFHCKMKTPGFMQQRIRQEELYMDRLNVGLFNDSFPPTIDGVAQAVKNYADVLHRNHCDVTAVSYTHLTLPTKLEV